MGPRPRRPQTKARLIAWFDRLDDVLPPRRENTNNPGHTLTRHAFLTLLRTQVQRLLDEPTAYIAAKRAIRAWVSDHLVEAVEWLSPACGEPVRFTPTNP